MPYAAENICKDCEETRNSTKRLFLLFLQYLQSVFLDFYKSPYICLKCSKADDFSKHIRKMAGDYVHMIVNVYM